MAFCKGVASTARSRSKLCGPERCDACALLAETRHTPATLRVVDRLYARDFELLGYQKIGARMMRLCGQRAARHAAIRNAASKAPGGAANRRPTRRNGPKKYRGPTRQSASTRNAEQATEDFGKHMKQWLEANQVPILPEE